MKILNTEEENNIHINSESRQQINGNKINNSQEVKNNNGNTVQLVPNAKKKNLKQIRIIQSLPIRTNEIELLELEQSLLKEERNKINNRYLHQAEIIRALRKKEQDLKNKTGISEISANIQQYLQNITSNVSELIKSQAVKTTEDRLPNIRSVISVSKSNDSTSKANKISEKTISRNDIEKASKKEVMSQRAKLLVRMKWPDKAIRLQLGFDKNAPGVKILISDEEVIEIRDLCLECEKMRNNVLKEGDKRYPKLKQIKSWISGTLIDERNRASDEFKLKKAKIKKNNIKRLNENKENGNSETEIKKKKS
ncbi:uncharacterized protein LOC123267865 [Cotesia glomerata]|uniref:uncharacterized protein LOC123267865 n=1 Tax=Cotesia glomerata TaxID=32391 RepID=UPI001D003964|nr:uncharacterized protein LOC123267865 [Cotesia glomerata]